MTFKTPTKNKKYKYNNTKQVRKWSSEKVKKNHDDINPEIFIAIALDGIKEWGWRIHPD